MDKTKNLNFMRNFWEADILPSLSDYIKIPNKSPLFDANWKQNGYMSDAVDHVITWVKQQNIPHLDVKVHQIEDLTPTITLEMPGNLPDGESETVLLYGHLDKQPEFMGWDEGLDPWTPVLKNERLYGRGGADDGYAIYASVSALKSLLEQDLPRPRIVIIIECSEESGSPDLPVYMDQLESLIGKPGLVIALDSTCGNYDQLWVTTSLRGMLPGELKVEVLEQGAHSGTAGGVVPSSFRILRQVLSRLEDADSGAILPSFLNEQIPQTRRKEAVKAGEVLADSFTSMFTYTENGTPVSSDPTELVLNNTWLPSLEITGMDGVPSIKNAGNVLRPCTSVKIALRLAPTTDAQGASSQLEKLLTHNPPYGVKVTFEQEAANAGWHAPMTVSHLESSLQASSNEYFGAPAISMGCGGSIPFMQFLARKFPKAQFVVTGVLGPHSNAHGPNEFLHIPTAIKLSACMANVVYDWGQCHK